MNTVLFVNHDLHKKTLTALFKQADLITTYIFSHENCLTSEFTFLGIYFVTMLAMFLREFSEKLTVGWMLFFTDILLVLI